MILITGANGMIGQAVAKKLALSFYPLRLQVRNAEFISDTLNQFAQLDFTTATAEDYERLTEGCETVIHIGALVHKPEAESKDYELVNVRATDQLARAAVKQGCKKFVYLSTSAVYGSGPFEDMTEAGRLAPDTPYGASKLQCEHLLAERHDFNQLILLRPSIVFGPGDRGNMIALVRQIAGGKYFHIAGNKARKSVIYADDLAKAIQMLVEKHSVGTFTFNVANPQSIDLLQLSDVIALGLGKDTIKSLPEPLLRAGASLASAALGTRSPVTNARLDKLKTSTTLNTKAIQSFVGFKPAYSIEDAIAAEINWARQAALI